MEHPWEYPREYPLFLTQILSELKSKHQSVSYPELCRSLCSRFDLVHLAKLRGLLFHTASLDPSFPASLFRDRMCCSAEDPHAKKLQVAADIVSMFSLIQNGGPAKDKPPMARAPFHKNHSVGGSERHPSRPHQHPPAQSSKPVSVSSPHQFIPATEPNFLLRVSKDLNCRAASLDKLSPLPLYSPGTPLGPSCEMQSTYFPMEADSESTTEQESLSHSGPQEPLSVRSCVHKRNIFKEDFHNQLAFSPKVIRQASECADGVHQRELHRPAVFFNHSFELPYTNPYVEPGLNSPLQERQRVKHESLDDLQASTYFGPSTVSESVSSRKFSDRVSESVSTHRPSHKPGRQVWPVKSLSLNTEYVPSQSDVPNMNKKSLKDMHRPNMRIINGDREPTKIASPAFTKKVSDFKGQDLIPVANGPQCLEKKEEAKWFDGKTFNSFQRAEGCSSVGTQTEQSSEPRRLKDRAFSRTDSEMISDDISDIFRFLDDMSVCDSLNMVQSSCYNSNGSLSQLTLKSDGDSSPERSTVRLAKSKLDSLFHSLENSDDELKGNVHRLVLRIGEIEKKLESLSGVRSEITHLLSKLNQLDQKIHKPDSEGTDMAPSHTESGQSPRAFQCHTSRLTTGHTTGQSTGYTTGHNTGQSTGHTTGQSTGYTTGHNTGQSTGHTTGQSTGYTTGHNTGQSTGHSTGHTTGQSSGHNTGHTTGQSTGHSTGHTTGHTTGHSTGHTTGHTTGHSTGHTTGHTTGHSTGHSRPLVDWVIPQVDWSGTGESLGVKALKNSLLRRSSRSLNQDPSPDWSTVVYCTERPHISRETQQDRQYDLPHGRRGSTEVCRIEPVFSPQPYTPSLKKHLKNSPIYSDLDKQVKNSPVYSELRLDSKRLHPSWTAEEYKRHSDQKGKQLQTLDMQSGEAIDPAHLEYWLEDVYTPGYDSLLRRKQADFRRARVCKLGALIAAATCTLILVIVVPICTMKT